MAPGVAAPPRPLSARARSRLVRVLAESRVALLGATTGLLPHEWAARPGPGRWSARDLVEHLVLTEAAVAPRVLRADAAAAAAAAARDGAARRVPFARLPRWAREEALVRLMQANLGRAVSPPFVRPRDPDATPAALLAALAAARGELIAFAATTTDDLRAPAGAHPYVGPLDRYQWALFLGAHTARHVAQIRAATRAHPPATENERA